MKQGTKRCEGSLSRMNNIRIIGDWTVAINGREFQIPPPEPVRVVDEKYRRLPVYDDKVWNPGVPLARVDADGCSLPEAVAVNTVRVRTLTGELLRTPDDYLLEKHWGRIGRVEGGAIAAGASVKISYLCILPRIDSIFQNSAGEFRLASGTPAAACQEIPAPAAGEIRVLNIYTDAQTDRLREENLFPVINTELPVYRDPGMPGRIPETMAKLRNGGKLRILAWGDSVTQCIYMPKRNRWQSLLLRALKKAFPEAEIEVVSNGWDGHTVRDFFAAPPGDVHNFMETVADVDADLVISEFINDAGQDPAVWRDVYPRALAEFRRRGREWIILTPHFSRPDWMGIASQRGRALERDPRPFTAFLREFAEANNIALADASRLYGQLQYCGIPYNRLMVNAINHPNREGMEIFVRALLPCFGL